MRPQRTAALEHDGSDGVRGEERHVLQPRGGRERGEREERDLGSSGRPLECDEPGVERREHERVPERIREHVGGEDEVRDRDREDAADECVAMREREAPRDQIRGDRGERHEERVLDLHQPVGGHR